MKTTYKRNLFIDSQLNIFALLIAFYHVVLLWGWIFVVFQKYQTHGPVTGIFEEDTFLTTNLCILAVATVILAYFWSKRKFTAIIDRIDDFCRLALSGKAAKFTFREYDPFRFFAETFNPLIVKVAKASRLAAPDYTEFLAQMDRLPEEPTEEDWIRLEKSVEIPE